MDPELVNWKEVALLRDPATGKVLSSKKHGDIFKSAFGIARRRRTLDSSNGSADWILQRGDVRF
jgi:hypothetical protein